MQSAVEVNRVTKIYRSLLGRPKRLAVCDVSFAVQQGEILCLLGPNGAGKTTIVKMLCGLLTPTKGQILINGLDAIHYRRQYKAAVGAVLEGSRGLYWRLSALENLYYFGTIWGVSDCQVLNRRSEELLRKFQVFDVRHTPLADLSRGLQQRVALGLSLVTDPDLLLLDEPTLGLDIETSIAIKSLITHLAKDQHKTIVLTTHDMVLAEELSDRVAILNQGKLVAIDRVANLANMWRTNWYEFVIRGKVSHPLIDKLGQSVRLVSHRYDEIQGISQLTFEFSNEMVFYTILDHLYCHEYVTVSAKRIDPDLEEVFLRLTHSGNEVGVLSEPVSVS
jgi:ABC-2 type transport system ATP-binding protein